MSCLLFILISATVSYTFLVQKPTTAVKGIHTSINTPAVSSPLKPSVTEEVKESVSYTNKNIPNSQKVRVTNTPTPQVNSNNTTSQTSNQSTSNNSNPAQSSPTQTPQVTPTSEPTITPTPTPKQTDYVVSVNNSTSCNLVDQSKCPSSSQGNQNPSVGAGNTATVTYVGPTPTPAN
jgi:hypothetical protein